jgi:hypothetical protein
MTGSASIALVGRDMCEECDGFLGKPHREGCSLKPGVVQPEQTVEKFTTVERAEQEDPLIGLDRQTVELLLRSMIPPEVAEGDEAELRQLRAGLETFVAAAQEVEDDVAGEPA